MAMRPAAILMTKLAVFSVLMGWIAFVGSGLLQVCCAFAAFLGLAGCLAIRRLYWRCPRCRHLLGAALGPYCTWCGQRIRH
jgi:hypothetical protein